MAYHSKGEGDIAMLYNSIIDNQLFNLIKMNLDIKEILNETEIVMSDIRNEAYPA